MMKKIAIAAAMAAVSSIALADSDSINATVDVIQPVDVTAGTGLNFGTLSAPLAGTATWNLTHAGVLSNPTAAAGSESVGSSAAAGTFAISGEPNTAVVISVSETEAGGNVTLVDGSAEMSVSSGDSLDGSGDMAVSVGASVDISAGATSGTATAGTIVLTANYN